MVNFCRNLLSLRPGGVLSQKRSHAIDNGDKSSMVAQRRTEGSSPSVSSICRGSEMSRKRVRWEERQLLSAKEWVVFTTSHPKTNSSSSVPSFRAIACEGQFQVLAGWLRGEEGNA